jgi:esterase/lipase superfamily enzyme
VHREFHKWWSQDLQRDMALLQFGHAGRKILVFPTSQGRFFEYEDNKMIEAVGDRIAAGEMQFYCVDSVDSESWYNKSAHPYWRVQRHLQYERYLINDVFPLMWDKNWTPHTTVTGCSFGAYHAVNFAFRHPDMVNACVSMGGAFDIKKFLNGWYGDDAYFNNPPDYLANCTDGWKYNHIRTVLATGEHDMCWDSNEQFAGILRAKGIRHEIHVWGDRSYHDWPWWRPMARVYL